MRHTTAHRFQIKNISGWVKFFFLNYLKTLFLAVAVFSGGCSFLCLKAPSVQQVNCLAYVCVNP